MQEFRLDNKKKPRTGSLLPSDPRQGGRNPFFQLGMLAGGTIPLWASSSREAALGGVWEREGEFFVIPQDEKKRGYKYKAPIKTRI